MSEQGREATESGSPRGVAVAGNFVVDILAKPLDRLPAPGQLLLLDALETHPGGNAPNTAGALALLGSRVGAAGRVGTDPHGDYLVERLTRWGVETGGVLRDPERVTGMTLVAVSPSGERGFLHHFGANAAFGPEDVPDTWLARYRHFHLCALFVLPAMDGLPAARLLHRARALGLSTSADVCWDREGRWLSLLRPCLPYVDWFLPSRDEARGLTGLDDPEESARALLDAGAGAVVVKLDREGCIAVTGEGVLRVPAFDVPVEDATGAGDCFIAGFLHAREAGGPLERALWFGNACGARAVSRLGAVNGMEPAERVESWARTLRPRVAGR